MAEVPEAGRGEKRLGERRFQVDEGIWRIPLPTGYPAGDVNAYWLDGPDPVLVDTGVLGDRSWDALCGALAEGGRRIEDIRTLLLTHSHVDHAANAWRIREASGCVVKVRQRAVRRLLDVDGTLAAERPSFLAFLARCGFSRETVEAYAAAIANLKRISRSCPGLTGIEDGDVTTGGGRVVRAHARPGHSSSCMVYEVEGTGLLLTGDHVLPHISPNPTLEGPEPGDAGPWRALPAYRESLRRTATMACELACPGHGHPFPDLAGRCTTLLADQDRRCRDVLRLVRDRGPLSVKDLSLALFGRVRAWDIFLTLSEIRGALDVLEDEGAVAVDRDGPVDQARTA
jgi:glyoxylase-like metal-dependent hydrolase (beta-lactamase superfamily II)